MVDRAVAWELEAGVGVEVAFVRIGQGRLQARGAAVRTDPEPYHLEYALRTGERYVTTRLRVASRGLGWRRSLDLRRHVDGSWTCTGRASGTPSGPPPGCEADELRGALDCDLGLSPLTNSMPVLRHGLLAGGEPLDFLMAWVSVPDLHVVASRQRYEFVARRGKRSTVRYRGSHRGKGYDIVFDSDGLVVDYPGLARRIRP